MLNLTILERTILANQYRILEKLAEDANGEEFAFKAEVMEQGYTHYYEKVLLSQREIESTVFEETKEILDMFRMIEPAVNYLNEEHKREVDEHKLRFRGFDGNNDEHYHALNFILDKEELFEDFKNRVRNSHTRSTLPEYRRMLKVYKEMERPFINITKEQLMQISQA